MYLQKIWNTYVSNLECEIMKYQNNDLASTVLIETIPARLRSKVIDDESRSARA